MQSLDRLLHFTVVIVDVQVAKDICPVNKKLTDRFLRNVRTTNYRCFNCGLSLCTSIWRHWYDSAWRHHLTSYALSFMTLSRYAVVIMWNTIRPMLKLLLAGQPPVLKSGVQFCGFSPRRGDTIHGLTWNLARGGGQRPLRRAKFHIARGIFGDFRPKKTRKIAKKFQSCKLFCPVGANPSPDFS